MKICIVCFDFKESNIRLQPWRYIYEISKSMKFVGVDVKIVSDGYPHQPQKDVVGGIDVHRLRHLRSSPFVKNSRMIRVIEEESPDAILWHIGATSFHFLATLKRINKPVIGLWMGTTYSLKQIMSLGLGEMTRNFQFIYIPVVGALIPSFLIKYVINSSSLKKIIVLNEKNKNEIINQGVSSDIISVIPPGIDKYDLELPDMHKVKELREEIELEEDNFIVLYLGSPNSLRGIDTLINAVSIICKNIPSLRLIILSRRPSNHLLKEERYIKNLCVKRKIDVKTKIISGFLDKKDIKKFIVLSDVVALPFKLVQSDTPIAILEVMALGKPVISTEQDGIPELLEEGRGWLINPNNTKELADAISTLYLNPQLRRDIEKRARGYMLKYPTWDKSTQKIVTTISEVARKNSNTW